MLDCFCFMQREFHIVFSMHFIPMNSQQSSKVANARSIPLFRYRDGSAFGLSHGL